MSSAPKQILVMRSCGLGDFILSAPAFNSLRRHFPGSRITLLTLQSADDNVARKIASYAGGGKAFPWVDLLYPHLIDDVVTIGSVRSASDLLAARKALSAKKFDLAVLMMDVGVPWGRRFKKMVFLAALVGFVRQVGWRRKGSIQFGSIPAQDPVLGHHVYGPLQFVEELGIGKPEDEEIIFDLRPERSAVEKMQAWIKEFIPQGNRIVSIAPGAAHSHKDWPTQNFVKLGSYLLSKYPDITIVVTGAKNDSSKGDLICSAAHGRALNLCGQTSITESAAFYSHCSLVVGNDGGAMHLADASGAAVVSVVPGLEFAISIEPWHNQEHAVRHQVPCAPCYSFTFCPQGHQRCMIDLPFEKVLSECEQILAISDTQ
jgi:heptosyltransferase II